jgi:hypothetical protein
LRKAPPRLTIEITEEQHATIKQYMEHGFQKKCFGIIVEDVCFMLNAYGGDFVTALLARQVNMRLYLDAARKQQDAHASQRTKEA